MGGLPEKIVIQQFLNTDKDVGSEIESTEVCNDVPDKSKFVSFLTPPKEVVSKAGNGISYQEVISEINSSVNKKDDCVNTVISQDNILPPNTTSDNSLETCLGTVDILLETPLPPKMSESFAKAYLKQSVFAENTKCLDHIRSGNGLAANSDYKNAVDEYVKARESCQDDVALIPIMSGLFGCLESLRKNPRVKKCYSRLNRRLARKRCPCCAGTSFPTCGEACASGSSSNVRAGNSSNSIGNDSRQELLDKMKANRAKKEEKRRPNVLTRRQELQGTKACLKDTKKELVETKKELAVVEKQHETVQNKLAVAETFQNHLREKLWQEKTKSIDVSPFKCWSDVMEFREAFDKMNDFQRLKHFEANHAKWSRALSPNFRKIVEDIFLTDFAIDANALEHCVAESSRK